MLCEQLRLFSFYHYVLWNLDIDKCSLNPCKVMKAQHVRQIPWIPYFNSYTWVLSGLRSRRFLGGVGFLRTLGVQLNNFLHRKFFTSHKLGILTRACWNCTICFETFIETDNSCCCTTISIIVSRYKTANSQISLMLCEGVRKFWKDRSRKILKARSRTFYLKHRNPVWNSTFLNKSCVLLTCTFFPRRTHVFKRKLTNRAHFLFTA